MAYEWRDFIEDHGVDHITDMAFRLYGEPYEPPSGGDFISPGKVYIQVDDEMHYDEERQEMQPTYTDFDIDNLDEWDRFFDTVDELGLPEPVLWYH